ncbi:cellulose biosynthesis protein CelD, partial [Caulobacter sp. HMWF009]
MSHDVTIETLRVSDLGAPERARWDSLRRANPALGSPYFDLRYIDVAGAVAPGARIAILRRDGQIVGFLPHQRRGGLLQPLGAP